MKTHIDLDADPRRSPMHRKIINSHHNSGTSVDVPREASNSSSIRLSASPNNSIKPHQQMKVQKIASGVDPKLRFADSPTGPELGIK